MQNSLSKNILSSDFTTNKNLVNLLLFAYYISKSLFLLNTIYKKSIQQQIISAVNNIEP